MRLIFMKIKALKDSIRNAKTKKQAKNTTPGEEKQMVDCVSYEGLVSKIYEEIFQLTNQNANSLVKIC